ncbi:DNA-binding transcriptional regulator, AcrR family [Sinosporangium album]|uniref:DNA-binding transcriptional regulator, AcrR family n=1 Tax=Sinosporangium album TaxID=504805 RepID=A0A1G8I3C8_9ACTN|nr:TetR/AcrR family transcriptional regulator [Sinosporangium album]SDI13466.1 DNA-binding transcriptional regulator, AcrR family [Sinosporangium album]
MPTPAPRSSMRERFREQVREDVKAAALDQLAAGGAQAISINAIAKHLGVSGPALYRYFANRDDLLTALVIDAYEDLHDALAHELRAGAPSRTPHERFRALAHAYRAWALAEPHRYELLFKPPLPGYDAHAEPLAAAARSLMALLLGVLAELDREDTPPATEPRSGTYQNEDVLTARTAGASEFHLAVAVWSCLHGIVSLELGGGLSAMTIDVDALFEHEVQVLIERTLV